MNYAEAIEHLKHIGGDAEAIEAIETETNSIIADIELYSGFVNELETLFNEYKVEGETFEDKADEYFSGRTTQKLEQKLENKKLRITELDSQIKALNHQNDLYKLAQKYDANFTVLERLLKDNDIQFNEKGEGLIEGIPFNFYIDSEFEIFKPAIFPNQQQQQARTSSTPKDNKAVVAYLNNTYGVNRNDKN